MDMAHEAPGFYEFEVSPDPHIPFNMSGISPPPPGPNGSENLKTALFTGAVVSFIFLISKDAHKAFMRRAHWIPCDFLVLSAFSIQLLNLLNVQNEGVKDQVTKGSGDSLWEDFFTIHNSRTILCVFAAYVMPAMADRGLEHSWFRWVALIITIFHHVTSEFYIVKGNSVFLNVLRLWPRQNNISDRHCYVYATMISLCFILLIMLLACATIAGRSIERILDKRISVVLRGEEDLDAFLAEKTKKDHRHPHADLHEQLCNLSALKEHNRRHCHYCWRTVEDKVLKAWIIVRAYSVQPVLARSALSASSAVIVTIQIVITIVGGLAKEVKGQDVIEEKSFKFTANILQSIFILMAWALINLRWATAVAYHTRSQADSWRSFTRIEDFWTRHLRELQEAGEFRPRQAQSIDNKIGQLVSKRRVTIAVPSNLLSVVIGLQWLLVSFSKACWFASLMILHNKLMGKLYSSMFENHIMYVFEDYPKYRKILEDVRMLGESPKSLWVANRKSIETAKSLIIQGNLNGEYLCEDLVEFLSKKRTAQGLGLGCLDPYKSQTELKFLCRKRPIQTTQQPQEESDEEKQLSRGRENEQLAVEERFSEVSTKSWKMTAVSLFSIIFHLSPNYAVDVEEQSSTSHAFPPKVVKDCFKAYSQAWEIIDFVEEADTEADGITSEAADMCFQVLQKKFRDRDFPTTAKCVSAALEELKEESKSKIKPLESVNGKEKNEQGRRNEWKGDDCMDWKAAASGLAVYKLCDSIECNDGTDVTGLLKELESCLADIINQCLEKVQRLLLRNSRKWALNRDERRMGKAFYAAGKAKAIMEKLE